MDLNTPDVDIVKKRLQVQMDDQSLMIKKHELRQLELQQEIRRLDLEKEVCKKQINKYQEELALYDKQ
jgi:hypothetical protein